MGLYHRKVEVGGGPCTCTRPSNCRYYQADGPAYFGQFMRGPPSDSVPKRHGSRIFVLPARLAFPKALRWQLLFLRKLVNTRFTREVVDTYASAPAEHGGIARSDRVTSSVPRVDFALSEPAHTHCGPATMADRASGSGVDELALNATVARASSLPLVFRSRLMAASTRTSSFTPQGRWI